jgi:IPT/TIG domain
VSPQSLDGPVSSALAAVCIIVFLAVLWAVCGAKSYSLTEGQPAVQANRTRRRFWYILLGADDRVSTSKVQLALWALALAYTLLVIAFHLGNYPQANFDLRYLLLLGFPAGAAVGAKTITMRQMASGAVSKDAPQYEKKTLDTAVKEIVSNDHGDLDLGDTQYFLFTLVALAAFFIAFFHDPTKLPVLPDTLVGLTSVSAAAYLAKKAVFPAPTKITAVSPQKGPAGTTVKIFGSGFGYTSSGKDRGLAVTIGGLAASVQGSWTDTLVLAKLPPGLPQGTVDLQVITADGRTVSLPNAFEVSEASGPTVGGRPTTRSAALGDAEPESSLRRTAVGAYHSYETELETPLKSKRLLVGLLAIAAMMLGWTPAALALHRSWLLPYLLIESIVIVSLAARGLRLFSPTRATVPEFLLAELNAAVLPALLGMVWLALYWAVYWAVRLVNQYSGLHGNGQLIALGLSLAFVTAAGVGVAWSVTRDLGTVLSPQWGGSRTKYFYMTLQPRATVNVGTGILVLGLAVTGAAVVTSSWTSTAVWVVDLLFVAAAGVAVEPPPGRSSPEDPRTEDVQTVSEVFSEQGYRVVAYPRTGKPDVDTLIQELDLLSYSAERAYAVKIKHCTRGAEPLNWTVGANVLDAARALERAKLIETIARVWPLLVLFEAEADESLRVFCTREKVSLICIGRTTSTTEIVGHDRSGDLQAIAHSLQSLAGQQGKPKGVSRTGEQLGRGGPTGAHLG